MSSDLDLDDSDLDAQYWTDRISGKAMTSGYGALQKKKPPSPAPSGIQAVRSKGNAGRKARDKSACLYKGLSQRKTPPTIAKKASSKKRKAKREMIPYVAKQKGLQSHFREYKVAIAAYHKADVQCDAAQSIPERQKQADERDARLKLIRHIEQVVRSGQFTLFDPAVSKERSQRAVSSRSSKKKKAPPTAGKTWG